MSLETTIFGLVLMLIGLYLYRLWVTKPGLPASLELLTAASIHTIEAAFLRAGDSGVRDLRVAAERCGRQLAGSLDPADIERDLARRGFSFDDATKRAVNRARYVFSGVTIVAAVATMDRVLSSYPGATGRRLVAVLALLYAAALVGIGIVTYLGTCTARGRAALAMRRAAYPLRLLDEVDPAEAVALYGGSVRLRSEMRRTTDSDASGCGYVYAGGGDSVCVDGASHSSSSHSCGVSSCSSSSCGGH